MTSNPMALIRVIDNDREMRKSLSLLLSTEGWKVAIYSSAEEFLEKDNVLIPGCLISEINMPKMSGLQLQNDLIYQDHALPLIFLTAFAEVGTAVSALRKGAVDFLTKPVNANRLLESVEAAVKKDWENRSKVQNTFNFSKLIQKLTPRENEVCRLVAQGLSNKAIGLQLGIAEKTVKVHRSAIYRKLDARTPLEVFKIIGTPKS